TRRGRTGRRAPNPDRDSAPGRSLRESGRTAWPQNRCARASVSATAAGVASATLLAADPVEKKREPSHALHRCDGERGARNAVDFAVQAVLRSELRFLELLQERGSAVFLPPALAIDEHAHVVDAPVDDDETRGDQLLLSDFLQDPHAPVGVAPRARAPVRG